MYYYFLVSARAATKFDNRCRTFVIPNPVAPFANGGEGSAFGPSVLSFVCEVDPECPTNNQTELLDPLTPSAYHALG